MQQYSLATAPLSITGPARPDGLLVFVAKIGSIIFLIEAAIMLVLQARGSTVTLLETVVDATLLTIASSPLIYYWAARPFAEDATAARLALARQLEDARELLEEKARLTLTVQQFSKVSSEIYDRTLQRIGADLHDGPAQSLTFALLQLERLARALETSGQAARANEARELHRTIHEAVSEVRTIAAGLALPELRDLDLCQVVELAAHRHWQATGIKANLSVHASPVVPLSQRAAIYRFVQEALANTYKHSHAKVVSIRADADPVLTISVSDDGRGFDPSAVVNRGLGLIGMQARIGALSGNVEVSSAPGAGTIVAARFGPNTIGVRDCG